MDELIPKLVQNDPYLTTYLGTIWYRLHRIKQLEKTLLKNHSSLSDFANGHLYFGLHKTQTNWVFREWAPNASSIFLMGEFSGWKEDGRFQLRRISHAGIWEIELPSETLKHLDFYKLKVYWNNGGGERIPSYANYVVQDEKTKLFCARVWNPPVPYKFKNPQPAGDLSSPPLIYEAHVGMAQKDEKVSSYNEFREQILPRVVRAGYNTIQLMAIQEHPYYGSFGYQVSNYFAPSSRFGSPDDLKRLIDEAHGLGIRVIMDCVHSHAVKNEQEGLGCFDGTQTQYFHEGSKGLHPAWDTYLFDYGKNEVLHFLLTNCKYWIEDFQFDGFRFDGVTSMLYHHHGTSKHFGHYDNYFNDEVNEEALAYLTLANKLIHQIKPHAMTVSEDMSGMPGMALPFQDAGIGFDYRLSMGVPDYWIKIIKERKDEQWNVEELYRELTNHRTEEKTISYAESHDQAIVGDQTLIFRLIERDMYTNMSKDNRNLQVDRGLALHKMIRLVTISTAQGGYLNFMGNEFGHPEWVDFPRAGNGWSYHYARRQWNLREDPKLCYHFLADFDAEMIDLVKKHDLLRAHDPWLKCMHVDDHVLGFYRAGLLFVFNFDPGRSYTDYQFKVDRGTYDLILDSDAPRFGGYARLKEGQVYQTFAASYEGSPDSQLLSLYLPSRTALVLRKR